MRAGLLGGTRASRSCGHGGRGSSRASPPPAQRHFERRPRFPVFPERSSLFLPAPQAQRPPVLPGLLGLVAALPSDALPAPEPGSGCGDEARGVRPRRAPPAHEEARDPPGSSPASRERPRSPLRSSAGPSLGASRPWASCAPGKTPPPVWGRGSEKRGKTQDPSSSARPLRTPAPATTRERVPASPPAPSSVGSTPSPGTRPPLCPSRGPGTPAQGQRPPVRRWRGGPASSKPPVFSEPREEWSHFCTTRTSPAERQTNRAREPRESDRPRGFAGRGCVPTQTLILV